MTKLVVLEVGNRREIMDAIGTDGCIYQMPTIRERLLEEKRNFLEERYLKYFDVIGNFEDSLEGKFEKKMKENPFRDSFCESLEITVPFMNDKEKEFINEYIDMIIPAGKQNAAKNGLTLDVKYHISREKREFKISLYYIINLGMSLKDMMNM